MALSSLAATYTEVCCISEVMISGVVHMNKLNINIQILILLSRNCHLMK